MEQLTIMMLVPDRARADIAIKADRIYYRFATDSTVDDGDLPGLKERFDAVTMRLIDAMKPLEGESPLDPEEVKVTVFVDNLIKPTKDITEQGLKRVIDELTRIDDVFDFVKGFA